MATFDFRFGHLTAGEHEYTCRSADLAEKVRGLIEELYDSDDGHYQVYFLNSLGESLSIGQSGLLIYTPSKSTQEYNCLPESRESIYEIAIDFVAGNFNWWIDRFSPDANVPANHAPLFARGKQGRSDYPLHEAALANDLAAVKSLIKSGWQVDSLDNKRRTPLILAASQGHLKICRYLIERGANLQAKDDWGNSVIALAEDHPELVAYLKKAEITKLSNGGREG